MLAFRLAVNDKVLYPLDLHDCLVISDVAVLNIHIGDDYYLLSIVIESYDLIKEHKVYILKALFVYGIHLGGMINEQMVFEFSELSFSQKNLSKKAGEGDVPFVSEELFFGGVRLPLWEG